MLIGKQCISTLGWNFYPIQTSANWRLRLKAPVGVPVLCKQRSLFICVTPNSSNISVFLDRIKKRIVTKITKEEKTE